MRRQYNPRLRQSVEVTVSFQTYLKLKQEGKLIMENIENVITPESIPGSNDSDQSNQIKRNVRTNPKKKHFRNKKNDQKKEEAIQIKTPGFSVFYPNNLNMGDRHKYAVSHYAINISPTFTELSSTSLYRYTDAEMRTTYPYKLGLKLGGHSFHQRVLAAAYQANGKFLVAAGQIEPLVNSFYDHMYTSRVLYSLLCTAWRCQQVVNAIDEDQLYLAGLFNQHQDGSYSQGYNNTTFATETAMAAMANIAQRQAFCFSNPTSNGVWANSIVTPILQNVRLTDGWRRWVEEKFMRIYAVDPTDFDVVPRYVVFWPTSKCGPLNSNSQLTTLANYEDYEDVTALFGHNASINDLINYINVLCAHQTQLIQNYPQLQLMWDYLSMSSGTTSFTRDLDAKSFPVIHSYTISKFIRSCSLPFVKYTTAGSTAYTVFTTASTAFIPTEIVISRDPVVHESSFKTFEMPSSSRSVANITYVDRTELDEVDMAMCNGQVAGLSLQLIVLNSSNAGFQWGLPLGIVFNSASSNGYTPVGTEFGGNSMNLINAFSELNGILTQGTGVLSRIRVQLAQRVSATLISVTGGRAFYDLKDYIVPSIEGQEWADRYRDEVLTK